MEVFRIIWSINGDQLWIWEKKETPVTGLNPFNNRGVITQAPKLYVNRPMGKHRFPLTNYMLRILFEKNKSDEWKFKLWEGDE